MRFNWRVSGLLFVFGSLCAVPTVVAFTAPSALRATKGWPRPPPENVTCTCFDRDTSDWQAMVLAEVDDCHKSRKGSTAPRTRIMQLVAEPLTSINIPVVNGGNSGENMFRINFSCEGAEAEGCAKAQTGFEQAGAIISSALALRTLIIVDAKFRKLGNPDVLGSAATKRFHVMADQDGVNRLYPQSLVKQLRPSVSNLADSDIVAEFNSGAKFWFEGEGPISADQHDFVYVVLHELVHGLGFASSWRDYFNLGILTPFPEMEPSLRAGEQVVKQFQEFAFDRFLVETKTDASLEVAAQTIQSTFRAGGAVANSTAPGPTAVDSTQAAAPPTNPQSVIGGAAGLAEAKRLFTLAQTANSMTFVLPADQGSLVIETSVRPYSAGTSMSHVDAASVKGSADFLMRPSLAPGKSLRKMVEAAGTVSNFGPMGPKLLQVMGALGYTLRSNPGLAIQQAMASSSACQPRLPIFVPFAAVCIAIWSGI